MSSASYDSFKKTKCTNSSQENPRKSGLKPKNGNKVFELRFRFGKWSLRMIRIFYFENDLFLLIKLNWQDNDISY